MSQRRHPTPDCADVLKRQIVFVSGKGGVGKTLVSRAIAESYARRGEKTLWMGFEDPLRPPGELVQRNKNLWELNCDAGLAFEEYAALKIRVPGLTRLFTHNRLIQFLAKAAPGLHELVLLGKLWHERENYDRIVADMPSTGYGLAMFQSVANYSKLLTGGPLYRDAESMLETFASHQTTGHLIVAIPEEMPLTESLELDEFLAHQFPANRAAFLVNRIFPKVSPSLAGNPAASPDGWPSPLATSGLDYAVKRGILEAHNLRIWREKGRTFGELPLLPPGSASELAQALSEELQARDYIRGDA